MSDPNQPRASQDLHSHTPRWVKIFGLVTLLMVLFLAVLHLTGHGFHHGSATPAEQPQPKP